MVLEGSRLEVVVGDVEGERVTPIDVLLGSGDPGRTQRTWR